MEYKILLTFKQPTMNEFTLVSIIDDDDLITMLNLCNDVCSVELFIKKELLHANPTNSSRRIFSYAI